MSSKKPTPPTNIGRMKPILVSAALLGSAAAEFAQAVPTLGPGGAAARVEPDKAGGDDYRQGAEAMVKGDERKAEKAFRAALAKAPRHALAMLGLAELAFNAKRLDEAGAWIDNAIKVEPKNAAAHAAQGRFLALKGQPKAAEAALRQAVSLDPKGFRAHIDLADMMQTSGRIKEAVGLYRQAVAIDAAHAGARYALGLALRRDGDLAGSRAELARAIELAPGNPLPHVGMAQTQLAARDHAGALASLDKAEAIQPTLLDALMLRGVVLSDADRADEALKAYDRAAAVAPKLAEIPMRKAMIEHQRGRADAAMVAYRQTIDIEPRHAIALNNMASLALEQRKDLDQAEAWAKRAIEVNGQVGTFHDTLGWVHRGQGNLKAALVSLTKAASLAPKDPQILYHLGVVQAESGDKARARQSLKASLSLSESAPSAKAARELLASLGG